MLPTTGWLSSSRSTFPPYCLPLANGSTSSRICLKASAMSRWGTRNSRVEHADEVPAKTRTRTGNTTTKATKGKNGRSVRWVGAGEWHSSWAMPQGSTIPPPRAFREECEYGRLLTRAATPSRTPPTVAGNAVEREKDRLLGQVDARPRRPRTTSFLVSIQWTFGSRTGDVLCPRSRRASCGDGRQRSS